jgi:hypothetical protein
MRRGLRHRYIQPAMLGALLLTMSSPTLSRAADQPTPNAPAQPAANATKPAAASSTPPSDPRQIGIAEQGPFEESTTIQGNIETDLQGIWLLIAYPEIIAGKEKYRSFAQLIKVSKGKDGLSSTFSSTSSCRTMSPRHSDDANRKTTPLRRPARDAGRTGQSATLPPPRPRIRVPVRQDHAHGGGAGQVDVRSHPQRNEKVNKAPDGKVQHVDRRGSQAARAAPDTRISQLMRRTTISRRQRRAEKDVIKGDVSLGFLAAATGSAALPSSTASFRDVSHRPALTGKRLTQLRD